MERNDYVINWYTEHIGYYFTDKTEIIQDHSLSQSEYKKVLTLMRKQADKCTHRYVTSIRYLDIIDQDTYNDDEIFSHSGEIIWSQYHSECSHCLEFRKNVRKNPIIGIKIWVEYLIPSKRNWIIFGRNK